MLEVGQSLEGPDKAVLDGVEGVFVAPGNTLGHAIGDVAVALEQLAAGVAVTRGCQSNQVQLRFVDVGAGHGIQRKFEEFELTR